MNEWVVTTFGTEEEGGRRRSERTWGGVGDMESPLLNRRGDPCYLVRLPTYLEFGGLRIESKDSGEYWNLRGVS